MNEQNKRKNNQDIFNGITLEKKEVISKILLNSSEGFIVTEKDFNKVILVNKAYTKITGYSQKEMTQSFPNIFHLQIQEKEFYDEMWEQIRNKGFWQGEFWHKKITGEKFLLRLMVFEIKNEEEVTNYVGIINDITEQKIKEEKIEYLSYYNVLTNMPNRNMFANILSRKLDEQLDDNKYLAVLILDVERFKTINDIYGYDIGNQLLKQIGKRLEIFGVVAHFEKDTFGILLEKMDSEDSIKEVAEKVYRIFVQPFYMEENEISLSCSMGISIYTEQEQNEKELIGQAEKAMIYVKETTRSGICLYTEEIKQKLLRKRCVQKYIKTAIQQKEFYLQYQPQIDLETGLMIGVEALLRWQHPELGFISPGEFIPIAEETGDIIPIGEWVIQSVCQQIREWKNENIFGFSVSVNISSKQFTHNNIAKRIKEIMDEMNIQDDEFVIELTESSMMENIQEGIENLHLLSKMGVRVSIDDFGTGYSSLSYLTKLPIYKLKIDRSFILDYDKNKESKIIIKSIIDLAHNLGFKVIAEGVEKKEQLYYLKQNQCDEIQGYYFSKPLLPEELRIYIQQLPVRME